MSCLLFNFIDLCPTTREGKNTIEEEKSSTRLINEIKVMIKEDITSLEARSILDTAKGAINIIKEKYALAQNVAKIGSVVGWMLRAIKNDYQVSENKNKIGAFNDYEQRDYDFDKLEKKLLGWDDNESDESGEEFQQAKY